MHLLRAMTLSFVLGALVFAPLPAAAGPPYQTDDPEPAPYRHYEVNVFGTYANDRRGGVSANLPSLEINYGLMPNVEFSVTLPYAVTQTIGAPLRAGYGDTEVAMMVRFVQEGPGRPQVAFAPAVVLPTGDVSAGLGAGLPKTFLPLWAQKKNGAWTVFGGGGLWRNPGAGNRDFTFSGLGVTDDIREGLAVGAEVYHQSADTIGGSGSTGYGLGVSAEHGVHAWLLSLGRGGGSNTFTGYVAYQLNLGPEPPKK